MDFVDFISLNANRCDSRRSPVLELAVAARGNPNAILSSARGYHQFWHPFRYVPTYIDAYVVTFIATADITTLGMVFELNVAKELPSIRRHPPSIKPMPSSIMVFLIH